jgi:hypothetical protein
MEDGSLDRARDRPWTMDDLGRVGTFEGRKVGSVEGWDDLFPRR